MKKIIIIIAIIGIAIVSCKKEEIKIEKEINSVIKNNKEEKKKKGEIACVIYDSSGHGICAGTRCGTPIGSCGKNYTSCKCIYPVNGINNIQLKSGKLIKFEEFVQMWNSDEGREFLITEGIYEEDKSEN